MKRLKNDTASPPMSRAARRMLLAIGGRKGRPYMVNLYTAHAFDLSDYLVEWRKEGWSIPGHATLNGRGEKLYQSLTANRRKTSDREPSAGA